MTIHNLPSRWFSYLYYAYLRLARKSLTFEANNAGEPIGQNIVIQYVIMDDDLTDRINERLTSERLIRGRRFDGYMITSHEQVDEYREVVVIQPVLGCVQRPG